MLSRNAVKVLFFVIAPALLTLGTFQIAGADMIYTEDFPTVVNPFPGTDTNYTEWTAVKGGYTAKLTYKTTSSGLNMNTTTPGSNEKGYGTVFVTAQSAFAVADFGDDVTVESKLYSSGSTLGGNLWIGLVIGNLRAAYSPTYDHPWTPGVVDGVLDYWTIDDEGDTALYPSISFIPAASTWTNMSMRAVKNGSDWDVTVTISQGSNSWNETRTWTDDVVTIGTGAITSAGYGIRAGSVGSTNYGDDFQVTMVPEPSSVVLLMCGLVGLLAYAWRKRK